MVDPARIEHVAHAHAFGEVEKDVEVSACFARRCGDAIHFADAPLGVGIGTFLLAPDRGGQNEVGEVAGRRGMKAILNDQKLDAAQRLFENRVVGE